MKKLLILPFILLASVVLGQTGYEIKVTLKPFKNQFIYLGHYSGSQFPLIDSAKLNDKSEAVFKGKEKLGGGIYIVVYPSRDRFFEVLIDKQQHFSVVTDTATLTKNKTFTNSPDNVLFEQYQQFMNKKGKTIDSAQAILNAGAKGNDSIIWSKKMTDANTEITTYRKSYIDKHPGTLLTTLFYLMQEPQIPPAAQHPGGVYDSVYALQYFKQHYWDGINFWDDRISRTPAVLFEERLDKYFSNLVYPSADSVNKEIDWMLGYASVSKELTRVLLVKFVNRYLNMKYMWEDAVFVHLYEKYFSNKPYEWLTAEGKKTITDRAYSLMANIMGNPAENIILPDTASVTKMLYSETGKFTLVCFYDPTCGHCRETLPIIDSMYEAKWKALGLKIFAVAKETDGTRKTWLDFIHQNHLEDWTNVFYSKEEEQKRINSGVPGYSQLYDVQTFPTLYLLDKDKRIMAKKLSWEQVDEILKLK